MLLLWISGRFGSTFVVSASLLIQTLRKRGPIREYIFSRPCRISLAKNKEGSRIRRTPPLDRSVYTLFKHSKKTLQSCKGTTITRAISAFTVNLFKEGDIPKAPQAESLRKHCNFISRQSLSKIAARQGSTSIYSFLQQFSDCSTSTGEINKRWLKFKATLKTSSSKHGYSDRQLVVSRLVAQREHAQFIFFIVPFGLKFVWSNIRVINSGRNL